MGILQLYHVTVEHYKTALNERFYRFDADDPFFLLACFTTQQIIEDFLCHFAKCPILNNVCCFYSLTIYIDFTKFGILYLLSYFGTVFIIRIVST